MLDLMKSALIVLATPLFLAQTVAAQEHWVATWAASPQQARPFAQPAKPPAGQNGAPAFTPPPSSFSNQTVRMIVRASIGGRRARVTLSNAYGTAPLTIGAARVALRAKDSAILPDSDRALKFGGKPSFTVPVGAQAVSDPVDLEIPRLADLAVSVYIPGDSGPLTTHATGLHTTYISKPGDMTSQTEIAETAATTQSWYWLSSIDVLAPAETAVIVAFGDSITDGATSTRDADASWPSALARRLAANPASGHIAVVNHGISGNRVLRDGAGVNALARLDRDVLSQPGVKWMILLEGINDIGQGSRPNTPPADAVTADDLLAAYRQIIERAHMHGIRVMAGTLTPYEGAGYYSETGEAVRAAVNNFIRGSGAFDAVVDFDAATRDAEHPGLFRPGFNNGDHLHPNDAGYKAMAEAIDLGFFKK